MSENKSENNEELSEKELDSLLADLESRAEGGGGTAVGSSQGDDEDLEAFLSRLDAEEASGETAQVATDKRDDDLDARFAELDNLQPDDLPAKAEQTKPAKKDKKAKKKTTKKSEESGEQDDAKEAPSLGARVGRAALKGLLFALPVLTLTWVVGAYLANWVSAGWLIAIVALIFAVGVPAVVSQLVKKGKFAWWAAGIGLVLTVGLTAPLPEQAGEAIGYYGHWPATTVSEIAGWETDNALVTLGAGVGEFVGGVLYPGDIEFAGAELGTAHALFPTSETDGTLAPEESPPEDGAAAEGDEPSTDTP